MGTIIGAHTQERAYLGEKPKQPEALGGGAPPNFRHGRILKGTPPKSAQRKQPHHQHPPTKPANPPTSPLENPQPNQNTPTHPSHPPTANQGTPAPWDPETGSREV